MVIEILSYNTSLFNPLLKLVIPMLFLVAGVLFYLCRKRYGGCIRYIAMLLMIGALAGVTASAFRFQGDFNAQFKWGESFFDLILAIMTLLIALLIRSQMKMLIRLFKTGEEG